MTLNEKPPQYMTSAELEEAITRHREHVKKLIAEARSRRAKTPSTPPTTTDEKPVE